MEQHAREKLLNKGADLIAANDVSGGSAFGADRNALVLVDRQGTTPLPAASKDELSRQLVRAIDERIQAIRPSQDPRQARR